MTSTNGTHQVDLFERVKVIMEEEWLNTFRIVIEESYNMKYNYKIVNNE